MESGTMIVNENHNTASDLKFLLFQLLTTNQSSETNNGLNVKKKGGDINYRKIIDDSLICSFLIIKYKLFKH